LWDSKIKRVKKYKWDQLKLLERDEAIDEMVMDCQWGKV
jgi:hypothetical protein